jgi:3'-phosphoadenosine 5'-phosphosulfate sulfotransferase (PAPS reductase)/FAD synthetase
VTRDPFRIDSPTCISFSGGRTSAYMLWRVLESNGGLPAEAVICFANTGKEEEATLRFVQDCSERWSVPIAWVEYRPAAPWFEVVSFERASRNGEPFRAMVVKERYLPSAVQRICTSRLKVRTMHRHLRSLGWTEWDQFIGIRADEQRRVSKIKARGVSTETPDEAMCMPLADARITAKDVGAFWSAQPFNLELPTFNGRTLHGNCDLCFLKPADQILSLIREKPERAVWWAEMEDHAQREFVEKRNQGAWRFRIDRPSYAQMAKFAAEQRDMFDHDEEAIACFCGD